MRRRSRQRAASPFLRLPSGPRFVFGNHESRGMSGRYPGTFDIRFLFVSHGKRCTPNVLPVFPEALGVAPRRDAILSRDRQEVQITVPKNPSNGASLSRTKQAHKDCGASVPKINWF
jgi:hypothetical protein